MSTKFNFLNIKPKTKLDNTIYFHGNNYLKFIKHRNIFCFGIRPDGAEESER